MHGVLNCRVRPKLTILIHLGGDAHYFVLITHSTGALWIASTSVYVVFHPLPHNHVVNGLRGKPSQPLRVKMSYLPYKQLTDHQSENTPYRVC